MYLFLNDYLGNIQPTELQAITALTDAIRTQEELRAEQEIRSWLIQRYDCDSEFTDTNPFNIATVYNANNRVYLTAPAYSASSSYSLKALTLWTDGNVYYNIVAISSGGEAWTPAHWQVLGAQYSVFYLQYPYPLFEQWKYYRTGDRVYWNGKIYQAQKDSPLINHEAQLQAQNYENIRASNIFPDSRNTTAAMQMWGTGTAYSLTGLFVSNQSPAAWAAGSYSTGSRVTYNNQIWESLVDSNTTTPGADIISWQPETWIAGDNRNQQMVDIYITIAVYYLSRRIAPQNVPAVRIYNYIGDPADRVQIKGGGLVYPTYSALGKLQAYAKGDTTAELAVKQPNNPASNPVVFGGNVKNITTNVW